jgi:hypothetical protein
VDIVEKPFASGESIGESSDKIAGPSEFPILKGAIVPNDRGFQVSVGWATPGPKNISESVVGVVLGSTAFLEEIAIESHVIC